MIKGIGIDIIELERIKQIMKRQKRFIQRILTPNELEHFSSLPNERRKIEFLAGRFAAKEAFAKASRRGIGALSFQHIEILANKNGDRKSTRLNSSHVSISYADFCLK